MKQKKPIRTSTPRRSRTLLLVGLLLLTLALAGLLTYQAQDAARSHRAAAESTLVDYAGLAAWEFSRRFEGEIGVSVHQTLHPFFEDGSHSVVRDEVPGLADFERLRDPETGYCGALENIDYYFRFNVVDRSFRVNGAAPSAAEESWVRDTLGAELASLERRSGAVSAAVFGEVEGEGRVAGYAVTRDADNVPIAAHGFVTSVSSFAPACEQSFGYGPLLPPSLTGGMPNDSIVSARVTTPDGLVVCSTAVAYALTFAATDTIDTVMDPNAAIGATDTAETGPGRLMVQAALRPDAADRLLIGGLPRSRLPLLLGLLVLTAGLVTVALIQLRREYELARLRDEFVSGVSHELRTPLAQIRMFGETLLLGRVRSDVERRRSLEIINREARRLGQLVENVLQFSRSERGTGRIAPVPTPLAPLIREVVEGFQPLARAKVVELRTMLDGDVAAAVDRGAVRQILLNLLDNAVKYGPQGQTVTVGVTASAGRVRLQVEDQGPGVPVSDRELVWESFSRLDRDVEAAIAGSGIGLAVVRELARQHGGRTWVEDAPGGGARFTVEFPDALDLAEEPTEEPRLEEVVA